MDDLDFMDGMGEGLPEATGLSVKLLVGRDLVVVPQG